MLVKIGDIVEALETQFDELRNYLDKETGEVTTVSREVRRMVEEDESPDTLPGWQQPEFKTAQLIYETPDRFLSLPSRFDVHEWQIMEDFASSAEDESLREELLSALHGRGAFRYFKDVIHRRGVKEDWYEFRTEAPREIAVEWLEKNGLTYSEA
jgi:hypothetical protein